MRLPSSEQKRFFEQAVTQYQSDLSRDTSAQAYLMSRGIGPEAAATFRLGVLRNPLVGHEQLGGRLSLPYITPAGVVNIRFRCLKDHVCHEEGCPKYLGITGLGSTLYNVLDFRKASQAIYVCEGEIDAMTLSLCGFPAIGTPGVKAWKEHYTKCFQDYVQVFAVADGDKAGREFSSFLAREVDARSVYTPNGEDINSTYVKGGVDGVHRWLAGATQSS